MNCKCGSGLSYEQCCGRFIEGNEKPGSALELMKSRYSAYALGKGSYLVQTSIKEHRYEADAALIGEFARNSEWIRLEIVKSSETGETGMVEFKAYYREKESIRLHHEQSMFIKEAGEWFYDEGKLFNTGIGRNELCPCGSGKKYKRCCG
jgi:SEC-C motif-containing protein